MGLMDSFKDMQEKQQQRVANAREKQEATKQKFHSMTAGIPLRLKAEYLGGYKHYSKKMEGQLAVYGDKIGFTGSLINKFEINKSDVASVTVEGQDSVIQQRTITRNVLLAGKSKTKEMKDTYITVTTNDGQQAVFHVADKSHMEVRPQILQKIGLSGSVAARPQQAGSVADELTKLASLKEQGVITLEEFDAKKAQLLGLS
jgi:hypothetical protein